jgi:hypothetical protein
MTQYRPIKYIIEKNKFNDAQNDEESTNSTSLVVASSLTNYLKEQSNHYPSEVLQILNFSLKQHLPHGDLEVGKCIFPLAFYQPCYDLSNIVEIHGFLRSFRPTQQGLALNMDLVRRFFHKEKIKALDFLKAIFQYKEEDFYNMKEIVDKNM